MKILDRPIERVQFLNAAKGGGVKSQALPILGGIVDELPIELDALLVTSDLQGVVKNWHRQTTRLLGEELADVYVELAKQNLVPDPAKTGVILAGDLYAAPDGDKRGASGDVRSVWEAFASQFKWVVGVQGNHDRFGTELERAELEATANLHLLDYGTIEIDNLTIGGVSGIIGDPAKSGRKDEAEFLAGLELVLDANLDLLILHQGPSAGADFPGNELVTTCIAKYPVPLVVCGHVHWSQPLVSVREKYQVLNVDSWAIVLTK